MSGKLYPISDALVENSSRHCSTLAINKNLKIDNKVFKMSPPDENSRNGTVTFVKSEGRVFAITCWHVVEHLRNLNAGEDFLNNYSFFSMSPRPYAITDCFIRPESLTEYHELDIGIRQVRADFVESIGKEPIDIDTQVTPEYIDFGLVVGFPEDLKYVKESESTESTSVISLPTVSILVEIDGTPVQRFKLFSEFDKVQEYETYSGMSGSPILWSSVESHGIFGIACQTNKCGFDEGKSIIVEGELATPEIIKHWISQIPVLKD